MMASGYKPSPFDLSHVQLTHQMESLVEKLADNAHNVWARERVKQGWTYGLHLVCFESAADRGQPPPHVNTYG